MEPPSSQPSRDIIVVGASAGGVEALNRLLAAVPADLPASVFVVLHTAEHEPGLLAEVLNGSSRLPVITAEEEQQFAHGRVYVAPPDRHLLVGREHLHVRRGPRENGSRPAIDPLFRSAAVSCSTRVIGVVLTGLLNDGSSGLRAIKRCGGLAIVQDPRDAAYGEMPQRGALIRRLATEAHENGQAQAAQLQRRAESYEEGAELLRRLIGDGSGES